MIPLNPDKFPPLAYRELPTALSNHARLRLAERTKMSEQSFTTLLERDWAMPLAYHPPTQRWHRLFYSPADAEHFSAVQSMQSGEVMTVLPMDYYALRNFYISQEKLNRARNKVLRGLAPYHQSIAQAVRFNGRRKPFHLRGHFVDQALHLKTESFGNFRFTVAPLTVEEAFGDETMIAFVRQSALEFREGRWVLYEVEIDHLTLPKPWSFAWEELESWQLPFPPAEQEEDAAMMGSAS